MRRLGLSLLLICLVAPAAALPADRSAGDGSLAVTSVNGKMILQGRGLVYGHLSSGAFVVLDYRPDDPTDISAVSGSRGRIVGGVLTYAAASDIRFALPSGRYTIQISGAGIDLSAVGRGTLTYVGAGTADDGLLTVNGSRLQPVTKAFGTLSYGVSSGRS
ncbi:MAG: hypothetical protein WCH31_03930 [Actinomycetes bacterium]